MINFRTISRCIPGILIISIGVTFFGFKINAEENEKCEPQIMVSLGDSYSSGEGIEPFYGQDKTLENKIKDEDWLAHRSEKSWPGQLTLETNQGTMYDNKDKYWFFVAASGATTDNLEHLFCKEYDRGDYKGYYELEPQLAIFDELEPNSVSYVTMTMGGNDVGFSKIITTSVVQGIPVLQKISFIQKENLSDKLDHTWKEFYAKGGTKQRLLEAYASIEERAGKQANIIIVGYPQLLSKETIGKNIMGVTFSEDEVKQINNNVTKFNNAINDLVISCRKDGMNIYFVSVEEPFKGHEAYSKEPYINEIIPGAKEQDLADFQFTSAYSIHPNEDGAKAYAICVQNKINEIEAGKSSEDSDVLDKNIQDMINEEKEKKKQEIIDYIDKKFSEWLEELLDEITKECCETCA